MELILSETSLNATDCDFEQKQSIIGSIFPEKFQFDGEKVQTILF